MLRTSPAASVLVAWLSSGHQTVAAILVVEEP